MQTVKVVTQPALNPSRPTRRSPLWLLLVPAVTGLVVLGTWPLDRYLEGDTLTDGQPHSLRILTWNIGKLYHARWDSRASDDDLGHVAQVIAQLDPDVVALQELTGPAQIGRLASLLGRRWRAKAPEDLYDRRAGLLTRLPVSFVKLPTSSGRIAQGATVTKGKVTFAVASVHLDAFNAKRRLLQAEEIVAGMERLGQRDFVIAGDFNFDASLVDRGSADNRLYRFLTQQAVDAGLGAGVTSVISRRLDYVFYRKGGRVSHAEAQVVRDKRVNIMDHDPLLVTFTIR